MKQAFTLIELLVVVLIIGILSAIALPHYQKAVAKSRAVGILLNTNKLVEAQKLFFLANGEYASSLDDLDIQSTYRCQRADSGGPLIRCSFDNAIIYFQWIDLPWRQCCAYQNQNWRGKEICQALTGQYTPIPDGATGGYCYHCMNNCPEFL